MNAPTPTSGAARAIRAAYSAAHLNAEVLVWQSRVRVGAALLGAALLIARLLGDHSTHAALRGLTLLGVYLVATVALAQTVRRLGGVPRWLLWVGVAIDLAAVFGVTLVSTAPESYAQALILGFAVLHFTEFHLGRRPAQWALGAVAASYLALIVPVTGAGKALQWPQQLVLLTLFSLAGAAFIALYGSYKERLGAIVDLFTRTEEGDFTSEFPVYPGAPPDSVTLVGYAYNRVRAQLGNLVLTDPLSGLLNRRGLERDLAREIARAVRSGKELALLALDVDHFKMVNDTLGHLAGDEVIREVGELLREVKRGGDVVARTGGDEFTLLLPETSAAGAFRLANRIREMVREHPFRAVEGRVPVTVSIGLVADRVKNENVAHDLHSRADEALYAAKETGRDRVTIWNANMRAFVLTRTAETARS